MSPKTYPVRVNDAVTIEIAAVDQGGETRVGAGNVLDFQQVSDSVEAIAESLMGAFKKVKPQKATVEFGVKATVKSGKLTTMIVEGGGEATIKVTLEWSAKAGSD